MFAAPIQNLSFWGLPYARFFLRPSEKIDFSAVKSAYSYAVVYSYEKLDAPGFDLKIQKTPVIDLSQDLESVFGGFRRDSKAGVKKSESNPDLRFALPGRDAASSYAFYKTVKTLDGVLPDIRREFENCIFFNAYFKNQPLVSMSFYANGHALRSKHIVSLRKQLGSKTRLAADASRKLIWEICRYAKANGFCNVDLGGINLDDPAKLGIAEFKLSFGGEIKEIYIYRWESKAFARLRRILNVFGKNIN